MGNLFYVKLRAIENMHEAGIEIVPVVTIVNGVNNDQVGAVVKFAMGNPKKIAFVTSNCLGRSHQVHHASVGTPLEVEHLNLGGTPPLVLAAFALNGLVITFRADVLLKLRISPGIFIAFTAYVIAVGEVHWCIHIGGWLPSWLHSGREHHLVHHDRPRGRYNVFLSLFDWLLGTAKD